MTDPNLILAIGQLPQHEQTEISRVPDAAWLDETAQALALLGLRKVRLRGEIGPDPSAEGWRLTARLGATVIQPCVRSLAPVRTRLELSVLRRYLKDLPEPTGEEAEMPEDDSIEPLTARIDLGALMREEISLALPAFPRADGAEAAEVAVQAAPPGIAPLRDDDLKPFAALKKLRVSGDPDPEQKD